MFHHEAADTERFEQVILESVRAILIAPDPESFLAWAREHIPEILDLASLDLDPLEQRRLANLLGTAVWNATPHPANGYRPRTIEPPESGDPCPCGSGSAYGDCCGAIDGMPSLSAELIWELLLDELSEPAIQEALDLGAVPRPLIAKVAARLLEDQDRPGRAVALLEPLFAGALDELGAEMEPAFDLLCDAYDRLDHWRKKQAFLERLCEEGSRALRAAAWQRRSTIHIDEGDFERAEEAFAAALRSDPGNPSTALLEITLLAAQHKDDAARERARFWLHQLRRTGFQEQGFIDFLTRAIKDPQEALVDSHADALDPVLVDLHDWVSVACARPLPDYRPVRVKPAPGRTPDSQLALFADLDGDLEGEAPRRGAVARGSPAELHAPQRVRRVETLWHTLFPALKPRSTLLTLDDEDSVWLATEWTDYLLGHPEAADSLDVLDDVATAFYEHPESALPWIAHALVRPLLERAWAIVAQALPAGEPLNIPWTRERNRPALRLLFRRYLCQIDEGEPAGAAETLETLLRLNPGDNHGVRAELMNHYLRTGDDRKALALARRFPDDVLADLAYGEVLALYRLGEQEGARVALRTAVRRLPRIPHYLIRKRVKRPRISSFGFTPGGEDQAWMYREAMRDVWEAEPGLLSWVKRVTA
jgi:tetratricopeptide (TPR) repeat protein